jgi:hypothetical protein
LKLNSGYGRGYLLSGISLRPVLPIIGSLPVSWSLIGNQFYNELIKLLSWSKEQLLQHRFAHLTD